MKKALYLVLALSLLSLSGCGSSGQQPGSGSSGSAVSSAQQAAGKQVEPLSSALTEDALAGSGTFSVSFAPEGLQQENGTWKLTFDAYDYDLYDSVDITTLAQGDTVTVDGESLTVDTVKEENGSIVVNGGLENGGVTFDPGEGGTYYIAGMDDAKDYHKFATATLPMAEDCVLMDDSEPEQQGKPVELADLAAAAGSQGFQAGNTTVTVEDGVITGITRSYMP